MQFAENHFDDVKFNARRKETIRLPRHNGTVNGVCVCVRVIHKENGRRKFNEKKREKKIKSPPSSSLCINYRNIIFRASRAK